MGVTTGPMTGARKAIADAVDVVKLIDQDQMAHRRRAAVDEAHKHGKPVVALAPAGEIRRGLIAGVDCFEHTGWRPRPAYPTTSSR